MQDMPWRPKQPLILLLCSVLIAPSACRRPDTAHHAAAPSLVQLSSMQEQEVRAVLHAAAPGTNEAGPCRSFLPVSGVRWSDVKQALKTGGEAHGLAIARTLTDTATDKHFAMRTVEGWPAFVAAQRSGDSVAMAIVIGPYPDESHAIERARAMHASVMQQLVELAKVPKVEPYTLDLPAE